MNRLKTLGQRLCSAADALVPVGVEGEVLLDEAREGGASSKTQFFLVISYPAVELGADQVKVPGLSTTLALTNRLGVLATQPRLDGVSILFLTQFLKGRHVLSPDVASLVAAR